MSYNESLTPNSNYPPMSQSQWDAAPWNEVVVPERDFDVDIEVVLHKTAVPVTTNDYTPEFDEETGHTYAITDDTDWEKAYYESHTGIIGLLSELEKYIAKEMEQEDIKPNRKRYLEMLLEDCKDWELYDEAITECD